MERTWLFPATRSAAEDSDEALAEVLLGIRHALRTQFRGSDAQRAHLDAEDCMVARFPKVGGARRDRRI